MQEKGEQGSYAHCKRYIKLKERFQIQFQRHFLQNKSTKLSSQYG